jgi:hypothetical protein
MKRPAVVALLLVGMALPGWGQRGGARGGGGSGHATGVGGGGFSMSGRAAFMGSQPGFMGSRPMNGGGYPSGPPAMHGGYSYPVHNGYGYPVHNGYTYTVHHTFFLTTVPVRAPYVAFPYGYASPYGSGYFGHSGYGEGAGYGAASQANYPVSDPGGYQAAPVDQSAVAPENEAYRSAYRVSVPPPPEEQVTLVFNDGRPPEEIHNYILTRSMLTVLDGRRRDIPVDQLDLAATEKANRAAGVDFQLPEARR